MYNLRYHIASLVGVFLALALGLVLGGLVVQSGGLESQQDALVEGLRKEFTSLRSENADLTEQNALLTAFSADMTDLWVTDRMKGQTVVVVVSGGRSDGLGATVAGIESAGGSAVVVTLNEPDLGLADEELRSGITSMTGDPAAVRESVVASLAAEWSTPLEDRPVTEALAEAGAIAVDGLTADVAGEGLVTIAARDKQPDETGLALASAFKDLGMPGIGAQTTTAGNGLAARAVESGLAAFDTLGTDVGRYTLVALFTGAESAYYGLADQAVAPFPDPDDL